MIAAIPRLLMSLLLLCFCLGTGTTQTTSHPGWTLSSDDDGINVYTRRSAHSGVKEVKIQFKVRASMEVFRQYLDHVPGYTQWVYKCTESRRLRTVDRDEFYYYVRSDFPFPVSDRDLVVHARNWIDPNTGIAHAHSVAAPRELAAKDDCVRIAVFESSWIIKPLNGEELFVTYEVKTNPGGNIPDWVTNMGVTVGPTRTMQALRREVQRRMLAAK
jgi:hypothetical protein